MLMIPIICKYHGLNIIHSCHVKKFHCIPFDRVILTEVWLSFWSEVHYNSLYASGGQKLISHLQALLSSSSSSPTFYGLLSTHFERKGFNLVLYFTDVPTRTPRKKHWLFQNFVSHCMLKTNLFLLLYNLFHPLYWIYLQLSL